MLAATYFIELVLFGSQKFIKIELNSEQHFYFFLCIQKLFFVVGIQIFFLSAFLVSKFAVKATAQKTEFHFSTKTLDWRQDTS